MSGGNGQVRLSQGCARDVDSEVKSKMLDKRKEVHLLNMYWA